MTTITAIFTSDAKATLTIGTDETVNLERMGAPGQQAEVIVLDTAKKKQQVLVGPGVFRILSKGPVEVTSDQVQLYVASTTNSKDGTFPDPPKATSNLDKAALHAFFVNTRSVAEPE